MLQIAPLIESSTNIPKYGSLDVSQLVRDAAKFEYDDALTTEEMVKAGVTAADEGLLVPPDKTVWIEFDFTYGEGHESAGVTDRIGLLFIFGYLPRDGLKEPGCTVLNFCIGPEDRKAPEGTHLRIPDGAFTVMFTKPSTFGVVHYPKEQTAYVPSDNAPAFYLRRYFAFHMALQCKDVDVNVIGPSPRAKAKRAARGLPPIVEYKKLVIKQHLKAIYAEASRDVDRTGPRYHFVRGHAREYKPGCKTMVVPHFRGHLELGRIEKTYEIKRPD